MLRTSAYATTAPPYGLVAQLFGSSTKAALLRAGQVSTLIDFASFGPNSGITSRANLLQYVAGVEVAPPMVTLFRLNGAQGGAGYFVSPYAPLFDAAV